MLQGMFATLAAHVHAVQKRSVFTTTSVATKNERYSERLRNAHVTVCLDRLLQLKVLKKLPKCLFRPAKSVHASGVASQVCPLHLVGKAPKVFICCNWKSLFVWVKSVLF